MPARWIENNRYYYCDLCKVWYGGRNELIEVEDPRKNLNFPVELEEQNDNTDNANSIGS
jgi:hypothetical protein